ncbi:Retrovirus-related Pol polyprotein from transposon TNT 1-94 [Senna tora]|uniref:Retrovirus-related Pol polyprotein from transposon TNT 1-94 n=1 Tax=Senna tora TaxID=362788 RepID=A0A834SUG9_9FABA|nr:Retrovirus-related Pol polyprotein from transposon TNT 1-94 [Senna tora]
MAAVGVGSSHENGEEKQTELASMVSQIIKQEMGKYLKEKETEEHTNFASLVNFAGNAQSGNFLSLNHGSWILDTGASSHICSNINLMQHTTSLRPPIHVHLPDSTTKIVHTKGQAALHLKLILHNVLLIPSFNYNLLSVNKLVKETDLHLIFHKCYCILQDRKSEEIIAIAGVRRNLYILESRSFDPSVIKHYVTHYGLSPKIYCNVVSTSNEKLFVTWHQRLGHCPLTVLNHISSLKKPELKELPVCDACHLAKQNRLPFPSSQSKAQEALELLHIDVWGPYATPSLTSAHYVLTIVDDYSRVTCTHLFKFKSQVPNILDTFLKQVQKQYAKTVKFIRTDNGQKAYKAYDLETHKIHVSRDIHFYESVFPFDKLCDNEPNTLSPTPILFDCPDSEFMPSTSNTNETSSIPISPRTALNPLETESDGNHMPDLDSPSTSVHTPSTSSTHDSSIMPIEPDQTEIPQLPANRFSTRTRKAPAWLTDYECNFTYHTPCITSSDILSAISTARALTFGDNASCIADDSTCAASWTPLSSFLSGSKWFLLSGSAERTGGDETEQYLTCFSASKSFSNGLQTRTMQILANLTFMAKLEKKMLKSTAVPDLCIATPLWRNGPPEKPVLCNACGSRFRLWATLDNYTPRHAQLHDSPTDHETINTTNTTPTTNNINNNDSPKHHFTLDSIISPQGTQVESKFMELFSGAFEEKDDGGAQEVDAHAEVQEADGELVEARDQEEERRRRRRGSDNA